MTITPEPPKQPREFTVTMHGNLFGAFLRFLHYNDYNLVQPDPDDHGYVAMPNNDDLPGLSEDFFSGRVDP